jgi:hypothetical protein
MRRVLFALLALSAVLLAGCRFTSDNGSVVDCPGLPTATVTAVTSGTCSWTASPIPTTTVTSTTTTAPTSTTTTTPPTTTSSAPPPSAFPTPATTGAPATTAFVVKQGDVTITTPNQVIDGWHVTGALIVKAPGVQIRNSWIEGVGVNANEPLDNEFTALGSARMTVSNTTIGNPATCNPQPGLGEHDYTADRVRIIGMGDGFRVSGSNVTVTNSFVQTCDDPNNHDDGIQTYCPAAFLPQPCSNVVVNHNTLSVAGTRNFTAPMFGGSNPGGSNGQIANSSYTNNLLWGGVFSIYTIGHNVTITGNRVATNRWTMPNGEACESGTTGVNTPQGCSYAGWVYAASDVTQSGSSCAAQGITWSDNESVVKDTNWQVASVVAQIPCA